jgi:hypothetical protein
MYVRESGTLWNVHVINEVTLDRGQIYGRHRSVQNDMP